MRNQGRLFRWSRALAVIGLLAGAACLRAQELPGTSACRSALQSLAQAEEALLSAAPPASSPVTSDDDHRRAVAARLLPWRQRVADACLGGMTSSPPPSQRTWIGAAPTATAVSPSPALRLPQAGVPVVVVPVVVVPSPRFEAPVTVQCTGMACLASDGSVLTRVGPTLTGPKGPCAVQGSIVRCP